MSVTEREREREREGGSPTVENDSSAAMTNAFSRCCHTVAAPLELIRLRVIKSLAIKKNRVTRYTRNKRYYIFFFQPPSPLSMLFSDQFPRIFAGGCSRTDGTDVI